MKSIATSRFPTPALLGLAALAFAAAPAQALSNRTFVSGKGSDANACDTVAAPCRSFQAAHDKTAPGGQIGVLDAGDYGPVHITKSIGIVNDGAGAAGALQIPQGVGGITIDAGASDKVSLRGLTISSHGGAHGVRLNSAASLNIDNCVIRGFVGSIGYGVYIAPTGPANFSISNTILSENTEGVRVWPQGPGTVVVSGVIDHVSANGNSTGLQIIGPAGGGKTTVTITDSVASNNSVWGVHVDNNAGSAIVSARGVVASHNGPDTGSPINGSGFVSLGLLRLAHSAATGNAYGVTLTLGGVVESYGDNNLRGNITSPVNIVGVGTFLTVPKQ